MSRPVVTVGLLSDRRAHYFMDQQIGLHGTIVSIALGVAGLAAASLFEVQAADRPYHGLLWIFWVSSLLAVGVVYSGMTASVYVLPSTIPTTTDIFLPFAVGLSEFMLFTVLTTPLTTQLGPRSLMALWFGCFCLFACFASISIRRVRRLFQRTKYDPPAVQTVVDDVSALMRSDLQGALATAMLSAASAIAIGLFPSVPIDLAYLLAAPLILGMLYGIYNQRHQAQVLETELSRIAATLATEQKSSSDGSTAAQKLVAPVVLTHRSQKWQDLAMDWSTYIPNIITGVVGLAGIGGAIFSSKMAGNSASANLQTSIVAEDRRAKVAEKRRIYARYLASIIEVVAATDDFGTNAGEADPDSRRALVVRVEESVVALVNALSELQLLAPQALSHRADDIGRAMNEHAALVQQGKESDAEFYKLRVALVREMRVDLGEPPD